MDTTLDQLKEVTSDCCVTIMLQTHRTIPENNQDPILLKNLVREAEDRLGDYNKETAGIVKEKLNKLADSIDHRFNLESLVLFVNEKIAEFVRLPVTTENKVIIDNRFATRDLVRAMNRLTPYYVLVLSRDRARLIEALNDKVTREVTNGFPMVNNFTVQTASGEAELLNQQQSAANDFFNTVDKQLVEIKKTDKFPVIICTDESNYSEYLKVANNKEFIAGFVSGNRDMDTAHNIIKEVWPVVKQLNEEKKKQRLEELSMAMSSHNVLVDFNDIWKAIGEGRGRTLFVKQGYSQPVKLENDTIEIMPSGKEDEANVHDIIDEMIEKNLQFGGDAVFINDDGLKDYQGLALVTRY